MKKVKFLIVAAIMAISVISSKSEVKTQSKDGNKVEFTNPAPMMYQGKIKFYNENKDFGYVIDGKSGREYYFRGKDCIDKIRDNDEVTFELIKGKKGFVAINIRLA